MCNFCCLSYGYPMVIVWLSYGESRLGIEKVVLKGVEWSGFAKNMQINLRMSNLFCNFAPDLDIVYTRKQ